MDFIEALKCVGLTLPIIILVCCGAIESLFFEIHYDEKKIVQHSPWTGEQEIFLDELVEIKRSNLTDHILLHSSNGTTIRITKYLNGAEELESLVRATILSA